VENRFLQKLILLGLLVSCSPKQVEEPLPFDTSILKNGDLLCRYGNGFFSKYFRMVSDSVTDYSHVGFVHITEDSIHVIHAEASELTFKGFVHRDPIDLFLQDVRSWGIYRVDRPDSIRNRIIQNALRYHEMKVLFDMDFNIEDTTEVYCTELIAECINKAVGEDMVKPATVIMGKKGFSVDDTFLVDGIFEVAKAEEE
jgi:hypothetical protein